MCSIFPSHLFLKLTQGSANTVVHGSFMKAASVPHGVDARSVVNGVMTKKVAPPDLWGPQWKSHAIGADLATIWKAIAT